jgi:hypothetical protein
LRQVRDQSPDVLQPARQVCGPRYGRPAAEATGAQGATKTDRSGLGLRQQAPGPGAGTLHAGVARGDSATVWALPAPAHDREAREGSSRKKNAGA